jgi:hypothetical protein
MKTVTIKMTEEDIKSVLQAYQTLQSFLEKFTSKQELYQSEFFDGLEEALADVKSGRFEEVNSFETFVQ